MGALQKLYNLLSMTPDPNPPPHPTLPSRITNPEVVFLIKIRLKIFFFVRNKLKIE